ncbi:hypothetical protein BpHYR1_033136 [Brachionus plicatilis]|uniref:Uncharacterized protein n=1 Tax=Brachionus plicatilis TaxID=10195 RepID=A0A3M7SUU3_BRAPC|nr:hypothetical protein BpHYR1_033136 [Brachionus plicatilis]
MGSVRFSITRKKTIACLNCLSRLLLRKNWNAFFSSVITVSIVRRKQENLQRPKAKDKSYTPILQRKHYSREENLIVDNNHYKLVESTIPWIFQYRLWFTFTKFSVRMPGNQ